MDRTVECSVCPKWITRCAHFDRQVLWLFPPSTWEDAQVTGHWSPPHWRILGPGELRLCGCGTHPVMNVDSMKYPEDNAATFEEAEALFYEREEQWCSIPS